MHVSRLKFFHQDPDQQREFEDSDPHEWEIDHIVDDHYEDGQHFFKVAWRGFTHRYDTWIAETNMHAPDLISAYECTKNSAM